MNRMHVSAELRRRVAEQSRHRCGYCLSTEAIVGAVMEIDHIIPASLGGETIEDNLWQACPACNDYKNDRVTARDIETGELVRLFDPRRQMWTDHFAWVEGGAVVNGRTPSGRVTVDALRLNRPVLVAARKAWTAVGWHPPRD